MFVTTQRTAALGAHLYPTERLLVNDYKKEGLVKSALFSLLEKNPSVKYELSEKSSSTYSTILNLDGRKNDNIDGGKLTGRVWESGFHTVDSGFQGLDSLSVELPRIQDSNY